MKKRMIIIFIIVLIIGGGIIILNFLKKPKELSNSEYIGVFQERRGNFQYVAESLQNSEQEIDINLENNEIAGNEGYYEFVKSADEEFVNSLNSIKSLELIKTIHNYDNQVSFYVNNLSKDYWGGYIYTFQEFKDFTFVEKIEDNWYLTIVPAT